MSEEEKKSIEPGKGVNKGCGRWIANCGHEQGVSELPITLSGWCGCGRSFTVTCSGGNCDGKDFYC
jgi:hypothetical protein